MPDGTTAAYIYLTCVNSDTGGPPFWSPPYDYDVNPFPPCQALGKSGVGVLEVFWEIILRCYVRLELYPGFRETGANIDAQ